MRSEGERVGRSVGQESGGSGGQWGISVCLFLGPSRYKEAGGSTGGPGACSSSLAGGASDRLEALRAPNLPAMRRARPDASQLIWPADATATRPFPWLNNLPLPHSKRSMDGLSSPRMMLSSSIGRPSSPSANVDDIRPAPAAAAAAGGSRNTVDPLALGAAPGGGGPLPADGGDDSGDDSGDEEMAARRGARRRVGRLQEDVPRVTDATGEAVMTSFQTFLETCVPPPFIAPPGRSPMLPFWLEQNGGFSESWTSG